MANAYLEGTYSEVYAGISQDADGLKALFRQFSFPGGIPSHVAPETGLLAASWHSNKFLNPARDGAVLPILHLNGYKIANPTVLARIEHDELAALMTGYGYQPYFVEGDEPDAVHQQLAATLDQVIERIAEIQHQARSGSDADGGSRPRWPMIVLRTPKGWTGPAVVDGSRSRGPLRAGPGRAGQAG